MSGTETPLVEAGLLKHGFGEKGWLVKYVNRLLYTYKQKFYIVGVEHEC